MSSPMMKRMRTAAAAAAVTLATVVPLAAIAGPAQAAEARVDNPYAGSKAYVNPDWSALAAAEPGGTAISNQPTFVWMDRIAAITGSSSARGLRAHLDTALAQGANLVQIVIYDLPGRDCAALASNGELGATELDKYKTQYIDPIAAIMADSKYANLRIVNIIEPDSLPNIVTNAGGTAGSTDACATMKANGNYEAGVGYALHTLGALSNVYNYIDAAHHGWLGWDSNMPPAVTEFKKAATTSGATVNDVAGFIVNTANYSALTEPNFKVTDSVNGTTVRQSKWVDWNFYVDELSFAQMLRTKAIAAGGRAPQRRRSFSISGKMSSSSAVAAMAASREVSSSALWASAASSTIGSRPRSPGVQNAWTPSVESAKAMPRAMASGSV